MHMASFIRRRFMSQCIRKNQKEAFHEPHGTQATEFPLTPALSLREREERNNSGSWSQSRRQNGPLIPTLRCQTDCLDSQP